VADLVQEDERSYWPALKLEIGILACAAIFLAEDVELIRLLAEKARSGVPVRLLLGDPDSPRVTDEAPKKASVQPSLPESTTPWPCSGHCWRRTAYKAACIGPSCTTPSSALMPRC
jgi:hypothetical protein